MAPSIGAFNKSRALCRASQEPDKLGCALKYDSPYSLEGKLVGSEKGIHLPQGLRVRKSP